MYKIFCIVGVVFVGVNTQTTDAFTSKLPVNPASHEQDLIPSQHSTSQPNIKPIISSNCSIGYFSCRIQELCLPQNAICNGINDCPSPDVSDEENCHNSNDDMFWNSYFPALPGKDSDDDETCNYNVSVSFYEMSKGKSSNTFGSAGIGDEPESDEIEEWGILTQDGCVCNREKLSCHNLHLYDLSIIPTSVEYLDLSGSIIETLDFNSEPGFPHLEHLILSHCAIPRIENGSFYLVRKLKTVHLTGNQLSEIPNATFSSNKNLLKLFLGFNKIARLDTLSFQGLESLVELDLRNNRLSGTEPNVFAPLKNLKILYLNHNAINVVRESYLTGLIHLEILSLSNNEIMSIETSAFMTLSSLKHLYLPWNKIRVLCLGTFDSLHGLLDLRLNNNKLMEIHEGVFDSLPNLKYLNLKKNEFRELPSPRQLFENLTSLQHVYFDAFWMCWWTPHVRFCEPKGDGISSVENLLDNVILRICVWIMGITGVIGNLFVIISRLILRNPNRTHSFYIKNLAVADLLMGLFLLSIAYHDLKFRGVFLSEQYFWRHSVACQFSGFLSTMSSEASVLILTLITLDRYLSIARPFAEKSFITSYTSAILITVFIWIVSFVLSYVPLSHLLNEYFKDEFYSTNGLCLPLQIHNPYDSGWEYSFTLFVIVNSLAFIFICFAYWRMLKIIQNSSLTLRTNQQKQDGLLTKRFGLVVLTDFLSWAPIIAVKLVAMAGVEIQMDLYAWLAIFALPVNSALNPIIYTLTTKIFLQQLSKMTIGFQNPFRRNTQYEESSMSMSLFNRNRTLRQTTVTTSNRTSLRSYEPGHSRKGTSASLHMMNNTVVEKRILGN